MGSSESSGINTNNEYALCKSQNLPNHTFSQQGLGTFIRQGVPSIPLFRTKQSAFRYAAYLITLAEIYLPDEKDAEGNLEDFTFEEVLDAVRNA